MEFLIEAFKKQIERYGYRLEVDKIGNDYNAYFYDLPIKLDVILCKLMYKDYLETKNYVDIFKTVFVCNPIMDNNHRVLCAKLSKDTYAKKMSMIDHAMRKFHENNSMINAII